LVKDVDVYIERADLEARFDTGVVTDGGFVFDMEIEKPRSNH
jgi:hypothetical protein